MDATTLPDHDGPDDSGKTFSSVHLPGLSTEKGLYMCNGSQELYRMMLEQFLATKAGIAEEVRTELAQGDRETARRMVHSMKSVAGTIGAPDLYSIVLALEQALVKQEEGESIEKHRIAFESEMQKILSGLKIWFDRSQ